MALEDLKITETDLVGKGVSSLAGNKYVGDADMLKARFDSKPDFIIIRYNELIDFLAGADGFLPKSGGEVSGSINPSTDGQYDLGSAAAKWSNLYLANSVWIGGNINEVQNIVPLTTKTYNLGGASGYWNNVYCQNIAFPTSGRIVNTSSGQMIFQANNETTFRLFYGVRDNAWTLCPSTSTKMILGTPNYKWGQIYSTNSVISTSDANEKNSIEEINETKAAEFILAHKPVSFKFNDGTSGRTHYGLIAQDVEEALEKLNISTQDFAGFIKNKKSREVKTGEDEQGNPVYDFENVEGEYVYGLRYEEYIAPLMACVKMLLKEREENEKRLKALETRLEILEKGEE